MEFPFIPYSRPILAEKELIRRSEEFFEQMDQRRSVRHFSAAPVPRAVIENLILTASSAPSGAHKQPWTFVAISNTELKHAIRELAEKEEKESYDGRMSEEWLKDLAPLGTDWQKEFIDIAPWIIVVFKRPYEIVNGEKKNNYYVTESVGIASGFLLAAIHMAGLVSLTHTPSPMNFLVKALERPENERPFLLIPVGYPADDAMVPDIHRRKLEEVAVFVK
ncbi:MAG TPA: nitroreductase family protein [Flavobacteriales bacterium]|nr:nitroreductase family protein [Flavobacteriales bacterium]